MNDHQRQLLVLASLALVLTPVFWVTDLDLRIAHAFFSPDTPATPWPAGGAPLWHALYAAVPWLTAALLLGTAGVLVAARRRRGLRPWRPAAAALLFTLLLGPGLLVNTVFKDHWGRPRPRQVAALGGDQPYAPPLRPRFGAPGHSFPSGHAAVGFTPLALWLLWRRRRPAAARAMLALALGLGGLIGVARMAAGGHFLSDVLWAGLLTWLAAIVSVWLVGRIWPDERSAPP